MFYNTPQSTLKSFRSDPDVQPVVHITAHIHGKMDNASQRSLPFGSSPREISSTQSIEENQCRAEDAFMRIKAFKTDSWPSAMGKLDYDYEVCAPEWEETLRSVCTEYDCLEDERRNEPESQSAWQQAFEEWRASQEQRLAAARSELPLAEHDLRRVAPLSIHLDRYQATSSQDRLDAWKAALCNWDRFLHLIRTDKAFSRSLSPAQRSSYDVLEDWWCSRYAYSTVIETTQRYMESLATEVCLDSPEEPSQLEEAELEAGIGCSLYHTKCYLLFLKEFHPRCLYLYPSSSAWNRLHYARQEAVEQAICQRMAWALVEVKQDPVTKPYPQPVRSARIWFEDVAFPERPFYLWDSTERRTVVVDLLERCPKYTCVSHTWGRWRKDTCADIAGVPWPVPENTLYDVRDLPQWLYELGTNKGRTRYIWFDLFCIPQDPEDPRQQIEIANQASIFRNCERCIAWLNAAEYLDGVSSALNWLGLRYLLSTSRFDSRELLEEELDVLRELAATNIELLHTSKEIPQYSLHPVGWFTSLWTLQEAVLCPAIEICSRNWDVMMDGQGTPISLTTLMVILKQTNSLCLSPKPLDLPFWDGSNYLADLKQNPRGDDELNGWALPSIPSAVSALMGLLTYTDLSDVLHSLSPMDVFISATSRQYTGDRAPAIMSALGATDWYQNRQDPAGMQIVQGMFPLALLQNAAEQIGSIFFSGRPNHFWISQVVDVVVDQPHPAPIASLLPFHQHRSEDGDEVFDDNFDVSDNFSIVDHPAVREWTIRADGSVAISCAGVLASASSGGRVQGAQVGEVYYDWYEPGCAKKHSGETDDLSRILSEVARTESDTDPESTHAFAVALYIDLTDQNGIILRGRRHTYDDGSSKMILIKVGTYIAKGAQLPAEQAVDWIVL